MFKRVAHLFKPQYTASFYLKSGEIIEVPNVLECTVTTSTETGEITSWKIEYSPYGTKPNLLCIPIPSIEAIVVE